MDYLLAGLGIFVSVTLFVLGYRQTIGAKKERVIAANAALERVLVRRVVLEKYAPKEFEIGRLIEGKARDHRVRATDLHSETQILNTVYTRIMESDLIPAQQREEILSRVEPALAESESAPVQEEALAEVSSSARRLRATTAATMLMALLASTIGGFVTIIPEIRELEPKIREFFPTIMATASVSLAIISLFFVITRLRASTEETTNKAAELTKYIQFESEVRKTIQGSASIVAEPPGFDGGIDFLVTAGDKIIAVETKMWSRRVPSSILKKSIERVRDAAAQLKANEAVIVTAASIPSIDLQEESGVKVMTLKEFRNYITHGQT